MAQQKEYETVAEQKGKQMGARILKLMNKKVAGMTEGIDKVDSYL